MTLQIRLRIDPSEIFQRSVNFVLSDLIGKIVLPGQVALFNHIKINQYQFADL